MPAIRRPQTADDLCAVFVHAGAGYHSTANEKYHLGAVNDAANIAMAVLKNGGDATDAVEMAIRLLEDREITNAGYGSNLTMDGLVECDATMVDHLGRSGGVGAVSQVRNPIALARLVLDESTKPLSLQRVPPNLLVGPGATEFAATNGMHILPPDFLVSAGAKERWVKWKEDLNEAAEADMRLLAQRSPSKHEGADKSDSIGCPSPNFSPTSHRDEHIPAQALPNPIGQAAIVESRSPFRDTCSQSPSSDDTWHQNRDHSPMNHGNPELAVGNSGKRKRSSLKRQRTDGSYDEVEVLEEEFDRAVIISAMPPGLTLDPDQPDDIIDTVGAIAVDCFGRIAAGSSSGGIGMKHRGRCGPAALVGVGTAVVPMNPDDPERTCVATVASGTGEHMATTVAAATAADRIYHNIRKKRGRMEQCTEDEALHSTIKNDFMKHPGVMISPCSGAIGFLAVKKSTAGIHFYFGHNTDSFAMASMHSAEKKPVCTMSRSKGDGAIAQGGRVCRARVRNRY